MNFVNLFQRCFYIDGKTDSLTRPQFDRKVDKSLCRTINDDSSTFMFALSVDQYEWIEHSLGYECSLAVSERIADRLKTILPSDAFITNYGGNRFLMFFSLENQNYQQIAKNIHDQFMQSIKFDESEVSVTCNLGISQYPLHGETSKELAAKANYAMQQAKRFGRSQFFMFRSSDEEFIERRMLLEKELRQALKNNELAIFYQPQTSFESGKIVGAEALLRWNHVTLGPISPIEFISIAEETGLIRQMGKWVLAHAVQQFKVWEEEGIHLESISVNISMGEFLSYDLIPSVKQTLEFYEMNPRKLKLELTESMAMNHTESVLNKLNQLKKLGIQLALDDFGTGYSSLHYLHTFPIDYLKVDQSFVRPIKSADQEAIITKSIVQMAKGLGLKVVAEGVETNEHWTFVKNLGCDEFQGFFQSPPVAADIFEKLYKQNKQRYNHEPKLESLYLG